MAEIRHNPKKNYIVANYYHLVVIFNSKAIINNVKQETTEELK